MTEHEMKLWCPTCVKDNFTAHQILEGSTRLAIILKCTNCGTILTSRATYEMSMWKEDRPDDKI